MRVSNAHTASMQYIDIETDSGFFITYIRLADGKWLYDNNIPVSGEISQKQLEAAYVEFLKR